MKLVELINVLEQRFPPANLEEEADLFLTTYQLENIITNFYPVKFKTTDLVTELLKRGYKYSLRRDGNTLHYVWCLLESSDC